MPVNADQSPIRRICMCLAADGQRGHARSTPQHRWRLPLDQQAGPGLWLRLPVATGVMIDYRSIGLGASIERYQAT